MIDLSEDESEVWLATVSALRSKGATHAEAVEGANIILAAYRRQRAGLTAQGDTEEPGEGTGS